MDDVYETYGYGDEDDIAEFERRCFGDQHASYLAGERDQDVGESSSEEDEEIKKAKAIKAPKTKNDYQTKIEVLEAKCEEKDEIIKRLKEDLKMVEVEATQMTGEDIIADLKLKLMEVTKKKRTLQVTCESQKTKISSLEKNPPKAEKEERVSQNTVENDSYKQKFLQSSNQLQDVRHEMKELKKTIQKQKKILLKELGSQEEVDKAFSCADDPFSCAWQGRAALITQLQRQVKEFKKEPTKALIPEPPKRALRAVGEIADERRKEMDDLKGKVAKLEDDNSNLKQHRDGFKSRSQHLEKHVRDLKLHVQVLIDKSENDDKLLQNWQSVSETDTRVMQQSKLIGSLQTQLKTLKTAQNVTRQQKADPCHVTKDMEAKYAAAFASI